MFSSNSSQVSDGGYQISRSLRFNSADSASLSRTPASAGNRRTWTLSLWFKRSALPSSGYQSLIGADSGGGQSFYVAFDNSSQQFEMGQGASVYRKTTQVFRDPSAWYHIVVALDTTQATADDRIKIYANGSQITAFGTTTNPSQNADLAWNSNVGLGVGADTTTSGARNFFNGYMTEVNFIDGQALTPSSFGETNAQTGVWQPKAYAGSYGTNGFYLNFSDNSNTTAATLGKDYSGNGNNWTPNNFSVSAGAGNDSLVDTPTPYGSDSGAGGQVRGNYCTLNPLDQASGLTCANGNLDLNYTTATTAWSSVRATFGMSTGKWYWEVLCNSIAAPTGDPRGMLGLMRSNANLASYIGSDAFGWGYYSHGDKYHNASGAGGGIASYQTGDLIGIAFDADIGTLTFYKNGTSVTSFTGLAANTYFPAFGLFGSNTGSITINFGQRPFAYTAPSGFKALCTQNLPTPTIGATTATQASKYFDVVLRNGGGSSGGTYSTTVDMSNGALLWDKPRNTGGSNYLVDSVRGISKNLRSNVTNAESTDTSWFTNFNSSSFTTGSTDWGTGTTVVDWIWAANGSGVTNTAGSITSTVSANTTSGFSIVTYTGNGVPATIGHGLGVAPRMILQKYRSSATDWFVYHASAGNNYYLSLNTTGAAQLDTAVWQSTTPTSSVFSVGAGINGNGSTMVAYCFAEVPGYSAFGSYTGNGSTDGTFVYTGFRPAYLLIKRTDTTVDWIIWDAKRNTYNALNSILYPNLSNAEATAASVNIDFLSNGFKLRASSSSLISGTFIFAAFAESPFKYSLAR